MPYDQDNEGDDPNDALQKMMDQRASGLFNESDLTTDESPVLYQPVDPRRFSRRPRKALNFMDQDAIDRADETPLTGDRYYQALEEYGIDPVNIASKEFINRGGVDPINIMERFKRLVFNNKILSNGSEWFDAQVSSINYEQNEDDETLLNGIANFTCQNIEVI